MIDTALLLLRNEMAAYVSTPADVVEIDLMNIALFETANSGNTLNDRIVITLVNIEEESTLKNTSPLRKKNPATAVYENPPVYLNLYILITSNYRNQNYTEALRRLSAVIRFLQSKNSFSYGSSGGALLPADPDILDLRFTMELYTLTFEQINHLWGSLGGRQVPFVMYKLRLVAITDRSELREVPLIEEIDTDLSNPSPI